MNLKKMKLKTLLLFFALTMGFQPFLQAQQQVVLSGKAPEYAGYQIELYRYADPISEEKQLLTRLAIATDGSFQAELSLRETTWAFATFDAYQASLFLEPGQQYELIFPPLKPVPPSQKRSAFFEADEISFVLKNSTPQELNRQIEAFELAYFKEESRYFNQIYHQQSQAAVDSLNKRLLQAFPPTSNTYFERYKFYRLAFAEFILHQGESKQFIQTYFIAQKPDLAIPPCAQLFKQVFSNQFEFEGNKIQGTNFKRLVGQANLAGIEAYLISENGWNSELSRLVILQAINDAYFQGKFSQRSLLSLLTKIKASSWEQNKKDIAQRLKAKLTYLQQGSQAPQFSMTDFKGQQHLLADFAGKYVYLNFTRVSNPICRQHLDQLKSLEAPLQQELQILNLIMHDEAEKQAIISQQNWLGTFYVVDEQTADKYRISNFPIAYLLDPAGKLVLSPAPNPLDGFEQHFINLLRKKHLEKQRHQTR
ncbi:redoxin domain-containing protein [uncultured Sunxiuqinia sp.]|uniref:peroxiredoxin family protein n=1 Tax=uncultured Sunxiuqinia sp. TaxID=1573825 RepID=UPI00260C8480|nr:redoxin domain-containing protein [uncultured Sunxiuqinia sp.]